MDNVQSLIKTQNESSPVYSNRIFHSMIMKYIIGINNNCNNNCNILAPLLKYSVSPGEVDPDRFIRDRHELGGAAHRLRPGVLQPVGLHQLRHQHEELQLGEPLADAGASAVSEWKISKGPGLVTILMVSQPPLRAKLVRLREVEGIQGTEGSHPAREISRLCSHWSS